ncbi:MAG: peroxidase-related enzyme [Bacteroidetes bacterium]|nr:peroxidase-related enzyme [Bacteroidota bacterium]
MAFIQIIEHLEAEGHLKEIYDSLFEKRGKIAEVHKIQSLNPETIVKHMDLYLSIMFGKSPLSRAQREMMAVIVSMANGCVYCRQHHAAALNHYWKDEKKLSLLIRDFSKVGLSEIDNNLCKLAWQLTTTPNISTEPLIINLKTKGLDDRAILDSTLVIAYFNFVNRIVLGLGVELEKDNGIGYKY